MGLRFKASLLVNSSDWVGNEFVTGILESILHR